MVKLLICDACIVNGGPVQSGSKVFTDQATANLLIGMGRAALAKPEPEPQPEPEPEDKPEPEPQPPKPTPRPRTRATTQPTTPDKED